jgi:hypothetical protein
MYKNATVAEWYRTHGKHEIYAKGKSVPLDNYEHSLYINPEDAARVRVRGDGPQTAAEEERLRRKATWEAAHVRKIYEEMVLQRKSEPLVQLVAKQ